MNKKCYHPSVNEFTEEKKCKLAEVQENGIIRCMIREKQKGFICDWERPNDPTHVNRKIVKNNWI